MSGGPDDLARLERIEQEAAAWVLRRDRGLTAPEQDAFSEWLAADPRHGEQVARHRRHWQRLDGLAEWRPEHSTRPNPDLLAPPLRQRLLRFMPAAVGIAAGAALAVGVVWWRSASPASVSYATAVTANDASAPSQRVLPDGSIVELNRGAVLIERFAPEERRVVLERGEAHFAVAKDPARPFVVRTRGVDVRAVGTAFNVRVDDQAVEVLVTEGRVQLETSPASPTQEVIAPPPTPPRMLEARQRAVVPLVASSVAPQVDTLTAGEIERVLAWQHRLLDFTATPIHQIVAEFNRRNFTQLVVVDPELASVRVSASLRSDNVDGFVRLLEAGFGARAERRDDGQILLRKGN